jgi:hypothetical protein
LIARCQLSHKLLDELPKRENDCVAIRCWFFELTAGFERSECSPGLDDFAASTCQLIDSLKQFVSEPRYESLSRKRHKLFDGFDAEFAQCGCDFYGDAERLDG